MCPDNRGVVTLRDMNKLLLAAAFVIAVPASGQVADDLATGPASPTVAAEKVVEGATAQRVEQVERCTGHKFEAMVEIDPLRNRSTRVKLCANPGATDADWVGTLEEAIVQMEQRAMPEAARQKLIGQLRAEIAKFPAAATPASPGKPSSQSASSSQSAAAFAGNLGGIGSLAATNERYETSIVPPLPPPLPRKPVPSSASGAASAVVAASVPAMRFGIKCLARGESGAGSTCDFFESGTSLVLSAIEGLDKGGTLRFRRKGDVRGEVMLAALPAGQSVRIRLPSDLCRGVSFTRIELELLPPGSAGKVAGRAGPYEMRC